jgi:hypothetical protein
VQVTEYFETAGPGLSAAEEGTDLDERPLKDVVRPEDCANACINRRGEGASACDGFSYTPLLQQCVLKSGSAANRERAALQWKEGGSQMFWRRTAGVSAA